MHWATGIVSVSYSTLGFQSLGDSSRFLVLCRHPSLAFFWHTMLVALYHRDAC